MPSSAGDPDGYRLARRRAARLSEAARVLRVAEVLIEDAGLETDLAQQLRALLHEQEQRELQRAHGRLHPRRRFRKEAGQPLQQARLINLLFVDESGVSHIQQGHNESFFTLGAVALDEADLQTYRAASDALKQEFFGLTDMTLHEPAMRRFDGPYYFAGDVAKHRAFDSAVNHLLESTPCRVFGVAINKRAYAERFIATGLDPYLPFDVYSLAVVMLMERYVDFLATSEPRRIGRVTFESQGPREDAEHQLDYARILVHGTQWMPPSDFQHCVEAGVRYRPKEGSDPLELADIVARDLYDWVAAGCARPPHRWHVLTPKIYSRDDRQMGKFGVKVFPDAHLRELVEAHRRLVP